MSRSVVYRERDSDTRVWEEPQKRTYTTVKRYQVPESGSKSTLGAGDNSDEKIIIRREKSAQPLRSPDTTDYRYSDRYQDNKPRDDIDIRITERSTREQPRQDDDWRYSERTYQREPETKRDVTYRVVERERENDYDDRRSSARGNFEYRSDYRSDYHIERDRQTVRAPSPPRDTQVREFRFERERERDRDWGAVAEGRHEDSYEIERYSKDTEYYQPAPIVIRERAPQPIIIRERAEPQPIIIREERREPQYEFIERREVDEEKSLVRREEPPPPAPRSEAPRSVAPQPQPQQEEDYFYERRVVERNREPPRRRSESNDRRTEIRPRDSASNYSSDDSYEHVKRTTIYEDDRDSHHKRHLAEGAAVGAAAGALINRHRNSERGEKGGTIKSTVGGAALGGLATEAYSRWRSRSRARDSRSRSRSRSNETRRTRKSRRRDRSDSRDRSRSRSKSLSRKQLAGLAGVAAVGAAVGYAINKRNKDKNETVIINERSPTGRSRSRRRRGSEDSYMLDEQLREDDKHRDPDHRNRRIAQAGLASAAAAGIFERVRSKSRGGKGRERSKSRVRQGVPIAAAGLGGAALAGLYEKNKASKEAKRDAIIADETSRGRRQRSRSRTYGGDPIPPGERAYYSDDDAPGNYRRRRGGSSGSSMSPDRRRRSRSRGRNLAGMGAAAGLGGLAAHEIGKRNDRKREDRERQRREDEMYDNAYAPSPAPYDDPPSGYLPPQQNAGYNAQQTYPQNAYFPPPPTAPEAAYADPAYAPAAQQQHAAYPPYNPADYAQPTGAAPQANYPYTATRGAYGDSDATLGAPYANDTFAGDPRYPAPEHPATPHDERNRGREPPNNTTV